MVKQILILLTFIGLFSLGVIFTIKSPPIDIFLPGEIELADRSNFSIIEQALILRDETKTLLAAKPSDNINLYISGYGGYTLPMNEFIYALTQTKATVTCHVTGPASSAHAMIALACFKYNHKTLLSPYSVFMLHGVQGFNKYGVYKANQSHKDLFDLVMFESEFKELLKNPYYELRLTAQEVVNRILMKKQGVK